MPTLSIRPATARDVPVLARLGAETFIDTYRSTADPVHVEAYARDTFAPGRVALWLREPRAVTLLALADPGPVGYAHIAQDPVPPGVGDRNAVHLSRIYLTAQAQGRGHGAALLHAALAAAQALGARSVWLGVYEHNPRAIAFYRRHGFRHAGTHEFLFGGTVCHDPVMERALCDPALPGPAADPNLPGNQSPRME